MNIPLRLPDVYDSDSLLMDIARRIQLPKSKHEEADEHFRGLCAHVDRAGSPLEGLVLECYPSGSFATGSVIASYLRQQQHDIDVVMELAVSPDASPKEMLLLLFAAINGEPGSRYHGKVKLNSRCVTVTYDSGRGPIMVDLMPISRLVGEPDRAGHLFHWKDREAYHKPVNPWGFAHHFNDAVKFDPAFYALFESRRLLAEGELIKAETQPMPDHVPLAEKSPRVVAIQLIKRVRNLAYRNWEGRMPPAVALCAMALEAGPVRPRLIDEVIGVASCIRERLTSQAGTRGTVQVWNPAYYLKDDFTDRWPENLQAQTFFQGVLRRLIVDLHRLRNDPLSLQDKLEILKRHFGETAADYAIKSQLDVARVLMEAGALQVGPRGRVTTGAIAGAGSLARPTTAARAATREGGYFPE